MAFTLKNSSGIIGIIGTTLYQQGFEEKNGWHYRGIIDIFKINFSIIVPKVPVKMPKNTA